MATTMVHVRVDEQTKDKERVRIAGALEGFALGADEANAIIMKARVKIGWIEELPQEPVEEASEETAEASEETMEDGTA